MVSNNWPEIKEPRGTCPEPARGTYLCLARLEVIILRFLGTLLSGYYILTELVLISLSILIDGAGNSSLTVRQLPLGVKGQHGDTLGYYFGFTSGLYWLF